MSDHLLQLQRRREHARYLLGWMAKQAEDQGCANLAGRLHRLALNVGARMTTPTPPALADKINARLPKLIAQAKADPKRSFLSLQPLPRRKKARTIRASRKGTAR